LTERYVSEDVSPPQPRGGSGVRRTHELRELADAVLGLLPLLLRDRGRHLPAASVSVGARPRLRDLRGEVALPLRDLYSVASTHRGEVSKRPPRNPPGVARSSAVVHVDKHLAS
ncbi:hypothetical protein THAOC_10579, partial [Thalassiosira oceanica]